MKWLMAEKKRDEKHNGRGWRLRADINPRIRRDFVQGSTHIEWNAWRMQRIIKPGLRGLHSKWGAICHAGLKACGWLLRTIAKKNGARPREGGMSSEEQPLTNAMVSFWASNGTITRSGALTACPANDLNDLSRQNSMHHDTPRCTSGLPLDGHDKWADANGVNRDQGRYKVVGEILLVLAACDWKL